VEVKWIEDFIALAQHQSFSRAAEVRNVTQSGLSRRIQALEQWIGAELIDRSSYPPTLTPAGRLFREAAEDMLGKLFDTRAIIRIAFTVALLHSPQNELTGIVAVIRDETSRFQEERALRKRLAELEASAGA